MGGKILKPRSGRPVNETDVDYAIFCNISATPQDLASTELLDLAAPPVVPVEPVEYLPYIPVTAKPGEGAERFLRQFLGGGPKPSKEVERASKKLGLDPSTLARAKQRIGVVSERIGRGWQWALPSSA
jgi:hypothetical protein